MISIPNLIKAGAIARASFPLREGFEVRVFSSDTPKTFRIMKARPAEFVGRSHVSRYMLPPEEDEVKLLTFADSESFETIRMGYSERLNILCVALL